MKINKIIIVFLCSISLLTQSQVLMSENFDTALNWTVAHPTGSSALSGWSRTTTGVKPTCLPLAGAGMAEFNSYDVNINNQYSLTSPAITFAGQFYKVQYSMYRNKTGSFSSALDNLKIYYNTTTSLTGATLLQTTYRYADAAPVVATDGWYTYSANIPYGVTGTGYIIILATSDYGNNIYLDSVSIEQNTALNDASLNSFVLSDAVVLGINTAITGEITNTASNTITTLNISWQSGIGTINNQVLTGLSILPGTNYNFSLTTPWVPTSVGPTTITVTISNTNGGDTNALNNTIIKNVMVVNEKFPTTVVYEEGTGTWCGFCVRGLVGLKDMAHNHPATDFIGIAVHNGDPMTNPAYDSAIAPFILGYPSGIINRNIGEVDPGLPSLEPAYQLELAKTPLGKINISNAVWNPTTKQITFNANAKFALDMTNANYNMAAIIVENGVAGSDSGYDQSNYYSGGGVAPLIDWQGVNYANLPNPIPATSMVYNHVGRNLIGGFGGFNGSIPTTVFYNIPYTYAFSYIVPTTQNINNIELVAVIVDKTTGLIVNANSFDIGSTIALANNTFQKNSNFNIFPNPSQGNVQINTDNIVSLSVIDILGKVVYTNNNVDKYTNLDLSNLQKGVYLVKIIGENVYATEKLILK